MVLLGSLGPLLKVVGLLLRDLEPSLWTLGSHLDTLILVLGRSWVALGALLDHFWVAPGSLSGALGSSRGALGSLSGRPGAIQNRSKNKSENRIEMESDPEGPKPLKPYACQCFRGTGTSAALTHLRCGQPKDLLKQLLT